MSRNRNGEADSEVRDKVRTEPHSDDSKLQRTRCTLFLPTKTKSHQLLKPFLLCNHSCAEEITCLSERGLFFPIRVTSCTAQQLGVSGAATNPLFFALERGKAVTKTEPDLMTSLDILYRMEVVKADMKCNINSVCSVGELFGMNLNEVSHGNPVTQRLSAIFTQAVTRSNIGSQTAAELMTYQS